MDRGVNPPLVSSLGNAETIGQFTFGSSRALRCVSCFAIRPTTPYKRLSLAKSQWATI